MTPLAFLNEELANVERVLKESLRHEYGPNRSRDYYEECASRLAVMRATIAALSPTDRLAIATQLSELGRLSSFISLLERSHLGEFSWPFADAIRRIADLLLTELDLSGNEKRPILHVVADGGGYLIHNEIIPGYSSNRRLAVVAFPRPLKHHVLLHTIFGHEIGHTTLFAPHISQDLTDAILHLVAGGPLASHGSATQWIKDSNAPVDLKSVLADYKARAGHDFEFTQSSWSSWVVEFFCDIFGCLLFGPSFAAAHVALLKSMHSSDFAVGLDNPTHPPYGVRHILVARVTQALGWSAPITLARDGPIFEAEKAFFDYIQMGPVDAWADIFTTHQLSGAIDAIRTVLDANGKLLYTSPKRDDLIRLIRNLCDGIPPVINELDEFGNSQLSSTAVPHILLSGWITWIGSDKLSLTGSLGFFDLNRLCDLALLQQCGIDIVKRGSVI
ncbi:hypothetical protein FJ960_26130 [Mesorhizobium sp. B2-3-11]|uniref:hypothetical protein n=1 Tax=Mesorhizobium sp. B2-3-11 TaxID=2589953 RepID=UPI001129E4E2|nr:hypothetical protein [Mesorhizobium sp. B2-3-11]TPL96419.1 hypothetical protein FJ960_26130 [Mesorhizobium sp. B2-3-11]